MIKFFSPTLGQGIIYILSGLLSNDLELHPLLHPLLSDTKSFLCLTLHNHFAPHDPLPPLKLYHLLKSLLPLSPDRLLLSSGTCFKTHLSHFGGHGYSELFRSQLFPNDLFDRLCSLNPRKLLYWRPRIIEAPKAPVLTWECRWCKVRYEEAHMKFEKMENVYCAMKCLNAHRLNGYK